MTKETVFYMRGPFPFGLDLSISEGFIEDAKLLLMLEESSFEKLCAELASRDGFLGRPALVSILSGYFPQVELAERASKFIRTTEERSRVHGLDVATLPNQMADWLKDREASQEQVRASITEAEVTKLSQRLPKLFVSIPALERAAKARSLADRVGQPLERLEIICDLRPVFDSKRETVEGMIPLTTLRLICKGADGLPVAFDAVLSERDVHTLATASKDAKKKLKRLRSLLVENRIATPDFTDTERKDSNVEE